MAHTPSRSKGADVERRLARCDDYAERDPAVWIHRLESSEVRQAAERAASATEPGPLRELTFAIKDNIDLAGVPTSAGCPGFAYVPARSAPVVARLVAAGAIPFGKTNLDQFATGLVGTRSPHGAPRNVFNPEFVSGGSSSGSAVAVAAGLVDFALGTDTAGSGRIPAAFNGLVGLKPTRGRLSTSGVVPACRSLDCVSILTRTVAQAADVLAVAEGFDAHDPFSRAQPPDTDPMAALPRRVGIARPDQLDWFSNRESGALYDAALERLRSLDVELIQIDIEPFLESARLLYEGPWTAERYAAVGTFIEAASVSDAAAQQAGLDPTVAGIILGGKNHSSVATFQAIYRLAELRRAADAVLSSVDAIALPTAGTIYTVAEVVADPVRLNSNLGRYTNFMNLLDLCGLAVPAGRYEAGPGFGLTLIGPAWHDEALLALGRRYLGEPAPTVARRDDVVLAVCGAHLRGQPLHPQLTALGARFVAATTTTPDYRLYALANTTPPKPGLVRSAPGDGGAAIAVETYALSAEAFGRFVEAVPEPLAIGTATLTDGTRVKSFLCEPRALTGATDITTYGGWAAYLLARG